MKSYLSLVSKYARIHRRKNRLTNLCIVISVMLVVAVFGLADMSIRAQINENIRQNGNWHAIISGLPDPAARAIGSRPDIRSAGWVGVTEDIIYQGKDIIVQGGDREIAEQMNLTLAEGNYPAGSDEALIDRQALSQLQIAVGDTVAFTFSDGQSRSYLITGTYHDFSGLKGQDAHGLFLSWDAFRSLPAEHTREYYYIQFNKGVNVRNALAAIKTEYQIDEEQVSANVRLLGLMGQSDDSSILQLYITAAILAFLVMAAGTFMIAASFNMSVLERTRFFGMLRCLGATKKQIRRYIRLEGLRYSLTGIPIGLCGGCVTIWLAVLFLNSLGSQYLPEMPLQISWPGLLAGILIGLVTVMSASQSPAKKAAAVSPQAAVTGNARQAPQSGRRSPGSGANTRYLRVDTAMGINHALANKKSMFFITGSFAISIILFLCFTVLISFIDHAARPLQPYAPDLSILGPEDLTVLDPALPDRLKELPGVKNVYSRMFHYEIPAASQLGNGTATLISYDEPQFTWAKEALVAGALDPVQNGGGVLIEYSKEMNWQVGDTVTLSLSGRPVAVRIAGILANTPFVSADHEWQIICSEASFTALTGQTGYTIIDMQVESDISGQVRSLLTPELKLHNRLQSNNEIRATYNAMAVFVYGFLIVIALVALINILNTVNTSVSGRMNHYGVMRAVGMSIRQLKRTVLAEAATYAVIGSLAGSTLGLLLHRQFFAMLITANWGETWRPPVTILAITLFAALLTTVIAVIIPTARLRSLSIINTVNDL